MEQPSQFHSPLYRHVASDGRLDLTVLYLCDRGIEKPFKNAHGAVIQYPRSILEGYSWKALPNRTPIQNGYSFWDKCDPSIYGALIDGKFDAVWVHGYQFASCWIAFLASMRAKSPILLRGESEHFFPRPLHKRAIKRAALTPLFERVGAFLYVSSYNREFYLDYGVPEEKLFYVPYGCDNDAFQVAPETKAKWRAEIRAKYGISEKTIVFAFASQHRPAKRPLDAVEAFCKVSPKIDTALLMLGDGPLRADAEAAARRLAAGHKIIFPGMIPFDEVRRYLAAADVLLAPSIENLGGPLVEGTIAGMAMISSDLCIGWRDMVEPGINGLVYRAGSIHGLSSCMTSLATHPELVASMRQATQDRSDALSFSRMTDGLVGAVEYVTRR